MFPRSSMHFSKRRREETPKKLVFLPSWEGFVMASLHSGSNSARCDVLTVFFWNATQRLTANTIVVFHVCSGCHVNRTQHCSILLHMLAIAILCGNISSRVTLKTYLVSYDMFLRSSPHFSKGRREEIVFRDSLSPIMGVFSNQDRTRLPLHEHFF